MLVPVLAQDPETCSLANPIIPYFLPKLPLGTVRYGHNVGHFDKATSCFLQYTAAGRTLGETRAAQTGTKP